jgi:pimeloyl-ACP methyl ester carboxylesterase
MTTKGDQVAFENAKTGYAPVNGLRMYYTVHGTGDPLVLLHGGVMASESWEPLLAEFTQNRQVITADMQAHGRTADIDRPLRSEYMADDVAALLEHLDIGKADLVGYSMGGGVAFQTAIRHPALVGKLVVISTSLKRDGWYPEGQAAFDQMTANAPLMGEQMKQSPLAAIYPNVDWVQTFAKIGEMMSHEYDWSAATAALSHPTMLIFADADALRPEHIVEFYRLLGGGQRDGGLDGSGRPSGRLAILPGTTHYDILGFPGLAAMVTSFLDAPI